MKENNRGNKKKEGCGYAMCQLEGILGVGKEKTEHSDKEHHEACGCGHDHEHTHEACSCGHDHEHTHEACGCGHDHEHTHEACGCRHDHEHTHEACSCGHEHEHTHEGCGCGHNHEHTNEGCGCGHDHEHTHEGCGCGHDHEHTHEACSCGHDHGHEKHHHHDGESCGCAMCQLEDVLGGHSQKGGHEHGEHHHHDGESCGCAMCQLENPSTSHHEEEEEPTEEKSGKWKTAGKIVLAAAALLSSELLEVPMWAAFCISLITILAWGWDLIRKAGKSLKRKSLDENVLMAIAVVAAFLLGEYFEAVMVVVLYSLGEILEEKAVKKSRHDIAEVVNIRPQKANLLMEDGSTKEIPSSRIRPGNLLLVRVGDRVPVDGIIEDGESSMDQSALTGEAIAVGVRPGDTVLSGSVNLSAVLKIRAKSAFEDSTASRMIRLVEESSAQKGHTEKLITRFAKVYTPLVVVCAALVAFLPPILGVGTLKEWIMRSLVFLVASCPCALVISVPLGLYSGVGAISKQGVLVKGTKFLEPLAKAKAVVLDKTGTLTTGELEVSSAQALIPEDQQQFEQLTALAEGYSAHPIAQAVLKALPKVSQTEQAADVKEIAGKGIRMTYQEKTLLCGSLRLLEEDGIDTSNLPKANVYTAYDGKVLGYVILSDRPREEAAKAIAQWKQSGIEKTVMLTGDSALSAQRVKEKCGVDEMRTDLLPQDKLTELQKLKAQGNKVIFVGDGINDAPVLAAADVGIAMGMGTDAAIEAADAVLMGEKLTSLTSAIKISRRALSVVHFNIWFILIIKLAVFALGIAGFANMWMAVFADVGVSIITVLNAVRILRFKD